MNDFLVPRPHYLNRLKASLGESRIKVITGVRRCGKSSLMQMFADDLRRTSAASNVIYLSFDGFDLPLEPTAQWLDDTVHSALDKAVPDKPVYIMLDEVQDVPGWERVVRRLDSQSNTTVFIAGSNARMLSSDLATYLAGRYQEIRVMPLSFKEYVEFAYARNDGVTPLDEAFGEYLRFGGMPGQFGLLNRSPEQRADLLNVAFESIILRDVAQRSSITDLDLLQKLVRYVFSTSGNLFSTNKIVNVLRSAGRRTSSDTVDNYLAALEGSLIVSECRQFGLAGKEILRPLRKFYPIDTGIRNISTGFAAGDTGFQLECVVYNELARRGFDVTVGTLQAGEVDFVATSATKAPSRMYVQVSESLLGDGVRIRETAPLDAIDDSFPKTVLTLDRVGLGTTDTGITIANLIDWLMDDNA